MAPQADVDWPVCGQDGCIGVHLDEGHGCLAHAGDEARDAALKKVTETGRIDARGVTVSSALLEKILDSAPRDPDGSRMLTEARFDRATLHEARFSKVIFQGDVGFNGAILQGSAEFSSVTFQGIAGFLEVTFRGTVEFSWVSFERNAQFNGATFRGNAVFVQTTFRGDAGFYATTFHDVAAFLATAFQGTTMFRATAIWPVARFSATIFQGDAWFDGAAFHDTALFDRTTFRRDAWFKETTFQGITSFSKATFQGDARFDGVTVLRDAEFDGVTFRGMARFSGATFERAQQFGPVLAHRGLDLDGVLFTEPVQIEVSTIGLCCRRARFPGGVQFRLRWARVVLDETDLSVPSLLTGIPHLASDEMSAREQCITRAWERRFADQISEQPRLLSLERANVAGLGLGNISLADCRFNGVHNLDQLRMEADVAFALSPARVGWEQRQVIAEESAWRANAPLAQTRRRHLHRRWAATRWPDWAGSGTPAVLNPGAIAGLYRALRKGREDAKDEPGAADFYYGEMEMRRHARGQSDSGSRGRAERGVLTVYWLVSGYGLRAWRAMAALVVLAVIITTALVGLGLAVSAPPQHLAGTITSSSDKRTRIDATLNTAQPELPPARQRWTAQRTQTALEVTLDSIAFRTTDQPLTTAGIWTTDAARILGPSLLVLALLAIRSRVKR